MKKTLLATLLAVGGLTLAARAQTAPFGLYGYATQTSGTTGGAGGTSVTVSTGTALMAAIRANTTNAPLTIYINGVITPANTPGLYFCVVTTDKGSYSRKLVVR